MFKKFNISKKIFKNIKFFFINFFESLIQFFEWFKLRDTKFILISNNCFGSELYISAKKRYNTPFVGLALYPDCYLKFLNNFQENINKKIVFIKKSKYIKNISYPLGIIDNDIEIHFIHYTDSNEALTKWKMRIKRLKEDMNKNYPLFLKICDRDGCTIKHLDRFHELPFENKISLGVSSYENKNHIKIPFLKDLNNNSLIDGFALFKKRNKYMDFTYWIKHKKINKTFFSSFLSFFS